MKHKHIVILVIILVVVAALTPFFIGIKSVFKKFDELSSIERIDSAFKLPAANMVGLNIRSGTTDTVKFNGVSIVNFWASWCKPCIEEIPSLEKLQASNPRTAIVLASFDSVTSLKNTIQKYKWNLPAYQISDTSIFKLPQILPTTYILKQDTVIKVVYGYEEWSTGRMKSYVDSIQKSM
jgi:thiol-disulfide isomerase/thioredoxin